MADNTKKMLSEFVDNIGEEKKAAIDIFSSSVLPFLEAEFEENLDIIEEYNCILILLLLEEAEMKKNLENAMYRNNELVFNHNFTFEGKQYASTVSNWLRIFIKIMGTNRFTNVELIKFLTITPCCRTLSENEKKILGKLLILYRNLKFFPGVFEGVPQSEWQIFPIERKTDNNEKTKTIIGPPKTAEEKKIDSLKQVAGQYKEGGLEQLALKEEIARKKKIEDLQIAMGKYRSDSLEAKVFKEEIDKLSRQ